MELLTYLLKVSACTVLFFSFYFLVLRKLTFFRINRFYLLVTLFLSFVIPALQFNVERAVDVYEVPKPIAASELPTYATGKVQTIKATTMPMERRQINWIALIPYAYFGIVGVLFVFSTWQMCRLVNYARKYTKEEGDLKLVPKTTGFTNCSFFNYGFINEDSLNAQDLAVLLKHEEVHASQFHSVDKIVLMVCKAVLWFNPIVYLFDKALEQAHEYEADDVTSLNFGTGAYAKLLLKLAISRNDVPLIHNFVKSPVKARIKMLYNLKSGNMKKIMYLLTVPVAFVLLWIFAVDVVYAQRKLDKSAVTEPAKDFYEGKLKGKILSSEPKGLEIKNNPLYRQFYTEGIHQKHGRVKKSDTTTLSDTIRPKFISSTKITGNIITKTSYMENAVVLIFSDILRAKYVYYNQKTNVLIAKGATLEVKAGNKISAQQIIFDLNKNTYSVTNPESEKVEDTLRKSKLQKGFIENKVSYSAIDSIKLSKDKKIITLFGNAKVFNNKYLLTGTKIVYNTQSGIAKASHATYTPKDRNLYNMKADTLSVKF